MHDLGSSPIRRGNRLVEIYNNRVHCNAGSSCGSWTAMASRGGSGVYYNNTISGYAFPSASQIYRVDYNNSWIGGGNCSQTGSMKVCQDFVKHCSGGDHRACYDDGMCAGGNGTCKTVYTCSSDSDCGTVKCIQIDGSGGSGYPCRDQIGRGKDDPATGVQATNPLYWWNNTSNGSSVGFNRGGYSNYIQENRDYCNHNPSTACGSKPGWTYTAYPYPHPWRGGMLLEAPKNLKIRKNS